MTKKAGDAYVGSRINLSDGGVNWHISEITWSNNLIEWKWDGNVIDSQYASPEPAWGSP